MSVPYSAYAHDLWHGITAHRAALEAICEEHAQAVQLCYLDCALAEFTHSVLSKGSPGCPPRDDNVPL